MLFAGTQEFAREDPDVFLGLCSLRGVALRASVCGDYEGFGFGFGEFEGGYVAVEFACVLADELVAFSDLEVC